MSDKQAKRFDEARKNLDRIQEVIAPFTQKDEISIRKSESKWKRATNPVIEPKANDKLLTRDSFFDMWGRDSRPLEDQPRKQK